MATFVGNSFNNVLNGTDDPDRIFGEGGDDTVIGGRSDDRIDGGAGIDIADYSGLGQAITLERAGGVNKGSAGFDVLAGIETIVGAKRLRNKVDGGTGTSGRTSFDLDLGSERLTVNGIPGLGSSTFTLKNFLDATGTSNSDSLVGNGQRNAFFGSKGNDFIDGGGGKDTVDYTDLGQAVTLRAAGVIDKGSAGRDQVSSIEIIIGAAGLNNAIDGSVTGGNRSVSFAADLNARRITVRGIPGIGRQQFQVRNFVDITATSNDDIVIGDPNDNKLVGLGGDDRIEGRAGDDDLSGGDGNDRMFGHDGDDTLLGGGNNDLLIGNGGTDRLNGTDKSKAGVNEQDRLIGGPGADLFVLGEGGSVFYSAAGDGDFAEIADFATGVDKIQLSGSINQYSLDTAKRKIFSTEGGGNELVAKLNGPFVESDFVFA